MNYENRPMLVSGGSQDGNTIYVPEDSMGVSVSIWNADRGGADVESYRIKTNPGPQAKDGTYPDYSYSLEFDKILLYVSPDRFATDEPWHRRTLRMRVAYLVRRLAERVSPQYLDPSDDDDDDWGDDW